MRFDRVGAWEKGFDRAAIQGRKARFRGLLTALVASGLMLCFASGATAAPTGQLAGTVTSALGKAPIEGIEVCAFSEAVEFGGCTTTSSNGKYEISGLPAGEYYVEFLVPLESSLNYVLQYYNHAGSYATATRVSVLAGSTTLGIDAELEEGGRIAGRVTSAATGAALEGALVCAVGVGAGPLFGQCSITRANGEYTITGLASGSYKVEFEAGHGYVRQFYNGQPSLALAQAVSVLAPSATSGIDAAMQLSGAPPANTTPPVVSGTPAVGGTLLCANGLWTGAPAPAFTQQWMRDGVPIPGALGGSYVVQAVDQGHSLSCQVIAKNARGEQSASSASVAIPAPPPPPVPVVTVAGSKLVVAGRSAKVRLQCAVAACHGSIQLIVRVMVRHRKGKKTVSRRETVVLAGGSYSLAAGGSATVELRLTSAGRKRFAHAKHHPVAVKLSVSVQGGSATVKSVLVS